MLLEAFAKLPSLPNINTRLILIGSSDEVVEADLTTLGHFKEITNHDPWDFDDLYNEPVPQNGASV